MGSSCCRAEIRRSRASPRKVNSRRFQDPLSCLRRLTQAKENHAMTVNGRVPTVYTDAGPGVVKLRSADAKSSVMILSIATQTMATPTTGKLVFNKYGDEYFLSQIWKAGSNRGNELRKSRREAEVAASTRRGVQSILASQ